MSREEDVPKRKTGYKCPPVEHQFKKGQSGNRAGRRPKAVRSLVPRQIRKDIIGLGESEMRVRTPDGERVVSAYEAVLLRLLHKALAGHAPSMRLFIEHYGQAIAAHAEEFKDEFAFIEMVEHENVTKPVPKENERFYSDFIDGLRKKTRRL